MIGKKLCPNQGETFPEFLERGVKFYRNQGLVDTQALDMVFTRWEETIGIPSISVPSLTLGAVDSQVDSEFSQGFILRSP